MFSYVRDASKIALIHLVRRLIGGGFTLLDTQFVTEHLRQFGTIEIERDDFHRHLDVALKHSADFMRVPLDASGETILQIIATAQRKGP